MSRAALLRLHGVYAAQTYFKVDANVPTNISNMRTGPHGKADARE